MLPLTLLACCTVLFCRKEDQPFEERMLKSIITTQRSLNIAWENH